MSEPRLNFRDISAVLVDRNAYGRSMVSQMLRAFGLPTVFPCGSGAEAQEILVQNYVDLCIVEADLPDMKGADLIRWIRREQKEPLRFVPILALSGYTQMRMLTSLRDAGGNLIVKKPLSAQALFDRIGWLARTPRSYIETANYVGPDRRFRNVPPHDGVYRRDTDPAQQIQEPVSPQEMQAIR
jgi:two-component system chemotaxis response regulator CheY